MYAGDATIGHGAFLGAAGRGRSEPSTWTSIAPAVSRLRAGGGATATVTIRVPGDAAPGERYGIAWAEVREAPGAGGGITQVSRVGIRLYISVGPGGAPAADFAIEFVQGERSADGLPLVVATVRNTGGRALDMNGTVALAHGPGGLSAGPFPARLGTTLAIGDTERVTTVLARQMPSGPWIARVTLRSGLLQRKAHATITFPGARGESSDHWIALAGALGLLLLLLTAGTTYRRRRRVPPLTLPLINN
jgi:LPXTG-motif cell wall-anchored protein